jgi:hypothetical protein
MRDSFEGTLNLKPHVTDIMVGNNETISSVSKGNYKGLVMQKDGSSFEVILQDVLYMPKLMVNLFSLTKEISTKGVQLSNKGQIITLKIGKNEIFFDTIFQHGSGQLWVLNCTLFQITEQPLLILWISTRYTPCMDILILKSWQRLFPSMVSKTSTHWSIPVLSVLSAKPNRRI